MRLIGMKHGRPRMKPLTPRENELEEALKGTTTCVFAIKVEMPQAAWRQIPAGVHFFLLY
jgi:hypothetical protein